MEQVKAVNKSIEEFKCSPRSLEEIKECCRKFNQKFKFMLYTISPMQLNSGHCIRRLSNEKQKGLLCPVKTDSQNLMGSTFVQPRAI